MTEEEKIICKQFLNDADKTHSCNEYKLLMALLEQEPKWIPVSEKLPEYGEEVLTCSNGGFIEIQSLEDSYDGYWENQKGDWTDLEEIIAWMPLPESYKEQNHE